MKFLAASLLLSLSITALADTSGKCPGEEGYYYKNYRSTNNPQDGGFVAYTAVVEDNHSIVIGRMAAICGNAIIMDRANISGNAIVRGNAEVSGSSIVTGDVILEGDVMVGGKSVIKGKGILSSGNFQDVRKDVAGPMTSSSSNSSKEELAVKIQDFVKKHAAKLKPTDGSWWDGVGSLTQSISFNGACNITIKKNRYHPYQSSSFYGESITNFNINHAYNVIPHFYSPTFSVASIMVKDFKSVATRRYRMGDQQNWENGNKIWYNHENRPYSNTVESLEVSTLKDAEILSALLKDLSNACAK